MLIKNWMSSPVVTIVPGANMPMAQKLMKKHNIHSLPVIKDDKLVGILTDRDLKKASASDATTLDVYELAYLLQKIKVAQIMTTDPLTIHANMTLAEAADTFFTRQCFHTTGYERKEQTRRHYLSIGSLQSLSGFDGLRP